jgi:hypothetical protein
MLVKILVKIGRVFKHYKGQFGSDIDFTPRLILFKNCSQRFFTARINEGGVELVNAHFN